MERAAVERRNRGPHFLDALNHSPQVFDEDPVLLAVDVSSEELLWHRKF